MPRNGSGTYSAPASSWNPGVNGSNATTADFNTLLDDLEVGLSQSVSSDGQTPMTGNLPMGNNKIVGVANGVSSSDAATVGQVTSQLQFSVGSAGGVGDRNLLVNSNFVVNQRAYISGAATGAANQVTIDRWRVVVSGQSITFGSASPDRVVNAPAGGLEQIIEAGWVAGGVYTLSWTGTATAKVNGVAILSGANTASLPANTAVTIQFASGSIDKVQFELGTVATTWQRRPPGTEMLLCQRECQKSYQLSVGPGVATSNGAAYGSGNINNVITHNIRFAVPMRVAPSFTLYSNNGVAGQWVAFTGGAVATSYVATASTNEQSITVQVIVTNGELATTGQWIVGTGL